MSKVTYLMKRIGKMNFGNMFKTIDMVHEASRNAVRSALVTIIENASNIKEWIFSKKNEHVVSSEAQEVDDNEK